MELVFQLNPFARHVSTAVHVFGSQSIVNEHGFFPVNMST